MDSYVRWLKETNQPVFETAGTYWRVYHQALVSASPKPEPADLDAKQARELLRRSGALFLRHFTRTVNHSTPFWYTACSEYNFKNLPPKVRGHIRRGYRSCVVNRVEPVWLAENGYSCYLSAFSKYRNSRPEPREEFEGKCRRAQGGPFEYWGVFAEERLVGFAKCAVGDDYASTLVLKLDPDFLHLSSGPAILDTLLKTYVSAQGKHVYAGFRSLVHDTNTHDFLLKVGYSRVYCDLQIVYRPAVRTSVNLIYSCRSLMKYIPESPMKRKIGGLLAQEEIRRSIQSEGRRPMRSPLLERIGRSVFGNRYGTTEK